MGETYPSSGDIYEVLNEVVVDRGSNPYLTKIECWERGRLITKVLPSPTDLVINSYVPLSAGNKQTAFSNDISGGTGSPV